MRTKLPDWYEKTKLYKWFKHHKVEAIKHNNEDDGKNKGAESIN